MPGFSNDLLSAATHHCPIIADIVSLLAQQTGCITAGMSGSGATCFGLFHGYHDIQTPLNVLRQHFPDYWIASAALQ